MEKIRHQYLRTAVANEIQKFIVESELKAGMQLPPEREFIAILGVGRSTLREALRVLEGLGVIAVQRNKGSFVLDPIRASQRLTEVIDEQRELLDLLDVRAVLEELAVQLAARHATSRDLKQMERYLVEVESIALENGDNSQQDWAFHRSVYTASHNSFLIQIIELVSDQFFRLWSRPFGQRMFEQSWQLHRPIFEAIADRDETQATRAVRRLMRFVREEIATVAE